MNYLKHYIKLIRKAQVCSTSGYTERHHVFPKSIFGNNDFIVKLTARQHYIAHAEYRQRLSESQKNKDKNYITDEYKQKLSEASKRVWAERKLKKLKEQQHGG